MVTWSESDHGASQTEYTRSLGPLGRRRQIHPEGSDRVNRVERGGPGRGVPGEAGGRDRVNRVERGGPGRGRAGPSRARRPRERRGWRAGRSRARRSRERAARGAEEAGGHRVDRGGLQPLGPRDRVERGGPGRGVRGAWGG